MLEHVQEIHDDGKLMNDLLYKIGRNIVLNVDTGIGAPSVLMLLTRLMQICKESLVLGVCYALNGVVSTSFLGVRIFGNHF
jgi:hypothetical protein